MKRFLSVLLATALIIGILPVIPVVATTSGGFGAYTTITGEDGFEMGYKVWTPDNFDPANNEYKLLIFFHNAGGRGAPEAYRYGFHACPYGYRTFCDPCAPVSYRIPLGNSFRLLVE